MDSDQATIEQAEGLRSGHTTTHTSTRTQRIEVITRGERRRRWSVEEKREIVAESLAPGVGPSEVIRKHGISSGQLYTWRQQLTRRLGDELQRSSANFARVDVAVVQRQEIADPMAHVAPVAVATPRTAVPVIASPRAEGLIEIVLPGGASVRVDAQVDGRALRRVLGALREP
jgi:transposase